MTVRVFLYSFFTPWIPILREEGVVTRWALTASLLILAVLLVRALLGEKISLRARYALWAVVLLRLLVPVQLPLSLPAAPSRLVDELPYQLTYPTVAMYPAATLPDAVSSEMHRSPDDPTQATFIQALPDGERVSVTVPIWSRYQVLLTKWWGGMLVVAGVVAASNLRFYGKLKKRRMLLTVKDYPLLIYAVEGLPSPCLFGVFRPAVYVTPEAATSPDALRHVLAHELTHRAHRDHIWALLRCLALALHWYNPLVWLAAVLSRRDGELACDEGAVARLGETERIPYGRTLVDMVAARSGRPADLLSCSTAMTGGKKSIRQRVTLLVKRPETAKTALFLAVSAVALAAVVVFARQARPDNTPTMFLSQLDRTTEIYLSPPLYSSFAYFAPIADEDLLLEAKEALSAFSYLSDDDPQPDLSPKKVGGEYRVRLTLDGGQMEYSLLWQKNRTYLFQGSIWEQSLDLQREVGETAQLWGVSGTCVSKEGVNVVSILDKLARRQMELNRDPSLPGNMTQEELRQYTPEALRSIGVTQLQGRPHSMETTVFHAGYTSPDSVELWYEGDDAHYGVWVLAWSKDRNEVLVDQPVEVYNAIRNAGEKDPSYEQLWAGAFAASLRPEDVTRTYLTYGCKILGEAEGLDISALKEQIIQGLYHKFVTQYAEEDYNQYSLTMQVEKDVGYYLNDDGKDGLTISIGAVPDVVCLRHRILASPESEGGGFVYSPELYRTIQALFKPSNSDI